MSGFALNCATAPFKSSSFDLELSPQGFRQAVGLVLRHQGLPNSGVDRLADCSDTSQRSAAHFAHEPATNGADYSPTIKTAA